MRLLNSETLELRSFVPNQVPDYVILSHRWGPDELLFDDITLDPISNASSSARTRPGFHKVQGACAQAARDGYEWIWTDSCCINKASSSELQESINSMWNYYARSNICYIYLTDVASHDAGWDERFKQSEWFTRGWTLQELLAPSYVEFYAEDWSPIGTKFERFEEIGAITGINRKALVHEEPMDFFTVAERLSWAAHRNVTREEDQAYSLLGLFDVNMPMLYGEGPEKAFIRLQEAIYIASYDQSVFLFSHSSHNATQPLLADCPTRFCQRPDCTECFSTGNRCFPMHISYCNIAATIRWSVSAHEQIMATVTAERNETSVVLSLIEYRHVSKTLVFLSKNEPRSQITHVAVLNHTLVDYMDGALCILLHRSPLAREGNMAYHRLKLSPAVLPRVGEIESRLTPTKIFFCPGPNHSVYDHPILVTFSLRGDLFLALEWSAKRINHDSMD